MIQIRTILLLFFFTSQSIILLAQNTTINGQVLDQEAHPLPRVSVRILNSDRSTQSNDQGYFVFEGVAPGRYILELTSLGYSTIHQQILLPTDGGVALSISMPPSSLRLDEATVSALRQEENPKQAPVSLSVVSPKQIADQNIWNIRDLTALVPNLNLANPGDNRNVSSIRGIGSSSYTPAIATYVDGVNQFSLDTYIPDLYDIARIEVLRGPQGTLYGRSAMGGVINVITRQPTNQLQGNIEATIGNEGQQRYQLSLRAPLVKDKLYLGAAGLFNKTEGYYTNDFNGSHYDKQHLGMGNYYLKYLPSTSLSFTLNYKHAANRNHGAFPLVFGTADALSNPYHLDQNAITEMVDNSQNASLVVKYSGKKIDFTSQTAYQSNHRYYKDPIDEDFSSLDGLSLINNYGNKWNNVHVWTEEFRFSSPAASNSRFGWTLGSYLFTQNNPTKQGTHYGADAGNLGAPDVDFTTISTNKATTRGVAFFGQANYQIAEALKVTTGLRYDYEYNKLTNLGEYEKDETMSVTEPYSAGSTHYSSFSPSASLLYTLNTASNVYFSYSMGFRPGGLTQVSGETGQAFLPFKSEYSNNYEVGIKNELWDHRLRINLAAFLSGIRDAQVPTLVLPEAITVTKNTGKMNSKGLELETEANPAKHVRILYSFGYTHATYSDYNTAGENENVQLKGNKPVFTPDITSMLAIQYEISISSSVLIKVGGGWKAVGKQYYDLANQISQGSYHLFNANLGADVCGYELTFWGQNLADKTYIDYAYDFGAAHLARPRTYGLTVRKTFL
ncbi:iron complex outermembrane recepter protein [bacterium A37T11]|nr:iron complex outermembrane recepter protein [bacterium A37T11]